MTESSSKKEDVTISQEELEKWKDYRRALLELKTVSHKLKQAERVITVIEPKNLDILSDWLGEIDDDNKNTDIARRDIRVWAKIIRTYRREYMHK